MTISVDVAENDEQGHPCGRATNITFSLGKELFISLETHLEGESFQANDRIIMIYQNRVKHMGMASWAGNMMWNQYDMPVDYGLGLLMLLQRSKQWQVHDGWTTIYDRWNSGELVTGADLDLDEDIQPLVVIPNQLGIPFMKRYVVDIKVYETTELYEIPIKPLQDWVRKHNLGGDFGGPEVMVISWKPGYYQVELRDDDLTELYKWQTFHQAILKILGSTPIDNYIIT